TLVPRVIFSSRCPRSSTAAMRRLVPPRSTPIEKFGISRFLRLISRIFDCQSTILHSRAGRSRNLRWDSEIIGALFLALRPIVAATSCDDQALNGSLANQAGLAFPTVNPVLQLKGALVAVGVHVV